MFDPVGVGCPQRTPSVSPLQSGLASLPFLLTMAIFQVLSGRISPCPAGPLVVVGVVLVGCWLAAVVGSVGWVVVAVVVVGFLVGGVAVVVGFGTGVVAVAVVVYVVPPFVVLVFGMALGTVGVGMSVVVLVGGLL